jgi:hypothetical protein
MSIDAPVIILIAIAAIVVAATAAQRAATNADLKAGRASATDAPRPGPLGPFLDALDESVAASTVRSWLGMSTLTRRERRAEDARRAMLAEEELRRQRGGVPVAHGPKRLVVAGPASAGAALATPARSTLSVELLAATLGLAVVALVVVGIWPRESSGAVLSVTATPAPTLVASAPPSTQPTTPP